MIHGISGLFDLIFRNIHPPSLIFLEILQKCGTDAVCRTESYHMLLEALIGSSTLFTAAVHCLFHLSVLLSFLLPFLLSKIDAFARGWHRNSRRVNAGPTHHQRGLSLEVISLIPDLIGRGKIVGHVAHSADVFRHDPTTLRPGAWVVITGLNRRATFQCSSGVEEFPAAFDFAAAGVCIILQGTLQLLQIVLRWASLLPLLIL